MLSSSELSELLVHLGLPLSGRKLVTTAREKSPVRKVKSSTTNVVTHYFSRKMGRVVSTESHTAEQQGAYLYEFDTHVFEYWAQPTILDLIFTKSSTGKVVRTRHYPDFLVITDECVYLDEWKQAEHLVTLSKAHPERYVREVTGWRSPVLEQHCEKLGISYRLRSTEYLPHQRIANLKFLADFLDPHCAEIPPLASEYLRARFLESAEIPLAELVEESASANSVFSTDDIYRAIALGQLCIDLEESNISDTERVLIYRDQVALRLLVNASERQSSKQVSELAYSIVEGSTIVFDGKSFDVLMEGNGEYILKPERGKAIPISQKDIQSLFEQGKLTIPLHPETGEVISRGLMSLRPKEMAEIVERREMIRQASLPGGVVKRSPRTLRRWRKVIREAGDNIIDQNLALVSRTALKGYWGPKLPEQMIELILKVQRERHNKPGGPPKHASYEVFVAECLAVKIDPCSEVTFLRWLKESVQKREGHRRAYQEAPIVWFLYSHEPIHGVRPWEFVHIDCTPVELVLRKPGSKVSLGTVHLCMAIDAESRMVLGFHLSFEKPSYRTTMMVIRDMVRRHGRVR